jgi:phage terminase large subunit
MEPEETRPEQVTTRIDIGESARFLYEEQTRYKVLHGGRGSLKSWSAARTLLLMGGERRLRILCAREFQNSIEDSVHKLLEEQIDLLGLADFYTVQKTGIMGANGTEFIFRGLRYNVESIKSLEGIDICWVEEAERVSETSWEVLIPTVRRPESEIWITFNPAQDSDPTYQRFVVNPPPGTIVRKVSWKDNPWLPDVLRQEAEHLRRTDPDAFAHVWEGETWGRSDAQVFAGKWAIDDFTPEPRKSAEWYGPYYGTDWGFAVDPTALVRCWVNKGKDKDGKSFEDLCIEHEAYKHHCEIADTPALFDSVPDVRRYLIRADCARPEMISHMQRAGFRIDAAEKWPGSVEDGITIMRSFRRIVVHPRCRRVAEEMRLYSHKIDKLTGDVMPELVDKHNHTVDAIRYSLAPFIKRRQPVFRGAVYDPSHWG